MIINDALIKLLRDRSNAPMMACKKALEQAQGDIEQAADLLMQSGATQAAQRASSVTSEGVVYAQIDAQGRTGFLIEINTQTDFSARDAGCIDFVKKITQLGLETQNCELELLNQLTIDGDSIESLRQSLIVRMGENIRIRRVKQLEGVCVGCYVHHMKIAALVVLDEFRADLAHDLAIHVVANHPLTLKSSDAPEGVLGLLDQPFIKNSAHSVASVLDQAHAQILSFARFELGEGIEKVKQDFAQEVMRQVEKAQS